MFLVLKEILFFKKLKNYLFVVVSHVQLPGHCKSFISCCQMTNTIQKKFKVSSTQLLYQSCPYQAITLFLVGPFVDGFLTNKNVFAFNYTPYVLVRFQPSYLILFVFLEAVEYCMQFYFISVLFSLQAFIVLSCLISVSVNFSTFLVIGKTSPVTYQVLGHLKTCLVLAFGYILLRDPFSWRNILGILVAVVGMVLYSYYCTRETQQQKASEASAQLSQVNNHFCSFLLLWFRFFLINLSDENEICSKPYLLCSLWYILTENLDYWSSSLLFFMVAGKGKWKWSID